MLRNIRVAYRLTTFQSAMPDPENPSTINIAISPSVSVVELTIESHPLVIAGVPSCVAVLKGCTNLRHLDVCSTSGFGAALRSLEMVRDTFSQFPKVRTLRLILRGRETFAFDGDTHALLTQVFPLVDTLVVVWRVFASDIDVEYNRPISRGWLLWRPCERAPPPTSLAIKTSRRRSGLHVILDSPSAWPSAECFEDIRTKGILGHVARLRMEVSALAQTQVRSLRAPRSGQFSRDLGGLLATCHALRELAFESCPVWHLKALLKAISPLARVRTFELSFFGQIDVPVAESAARIIHDALKQRDAVFTRLRLLCIVVPHRQADSGAIFERTLGVLCRARRIPLRYSHHLAP